MFPYRPSIVARALPGGSGLAAKRSEVIWQRLVLQITKGIAMERAARPDLGQVQGYYPCSMEKEIAYMAIRRASDSLWKRY